MPAAAIAGDGQSFPVSTPLADEISKTLKRRGFRAVAPAIVYAWMQAVGLVNDHSSRCFRRMRVAPEDLGRHRRCPFGAITAIRFDTDFTMTIDGRGVRAASSIDLINSADESSVDTDYPLKTAAMTDLRREQGCPTHT